MKKDKANNQQVRIIGGDWRGRKISFPDIQNLRPSSDRVRETLFNWLSPNIRGSRCLDLFAGSGALGLEAISRGAKHVVLVDNSPEIVAVLKSNAKLLQAENNAHVLCDHAKNFIAVHQQHPFDIIFIDPPFAQTELLQLTHHIVKNKISQQNTLIYVETDVRNNAPNFPECWSVLREKTTRQVRYQLAIQKLI